MKDNEKNHKGYDDLLSCPDCGGGINMTVKGVGCLRCGYQKSAQGPLDLRPCNPTLCNITMTRIEKESPMASLEKIVIERPPLTYSGPRAQRDFCELMSVIQSFMKPGASVLDLGSG